MRSSAGSRPLAAAMACAVSCAVGFDPARHQPAGRIESRRVERGEPRCAFARHAPQHGIDQAGEAHRVAVRLRQAAPKDRRRHDRARRETGFARRREAARSRRAAPAAADRDRETAPSRWRNVPSRRSTVATSARVSARSRSSSAASSRVSVEHARRARGGGGARHRRCRRRCGAPRGPAQSGSQPRRERFRLAATAFIRKIPPCSLGHGYAKSERRCQPTTPTSRAARNEAEQKQSGKRAADAGGRTRARRSRGAPRRTRTRQNAEQPKEVGGRGGPDPTRYGDWEINGLISDF